MLGIVHGYKNVHMYASADAAVKMLGQPTGAETDMQLLCATTPAAVH